MSRTFALIRVLWRDRRQVWAIARLPIVLSLLLSVLLPLPTHSDTIACPLQARLSVGSLARVAYTLAIIPSISRPLRDYPAVDAPLIGDQPPGTPLRVLQGPTCAGGVRWWQVQPLATSLGSLIGWMAETDSASAYVLEPWQVLLDYAQPTLNGAAVLRVNAQGAARWLIADPIAPIDGNGLRQFPAAESAPLITAYAAAYVACPDRAAWVDPAPDQQLTVYRSPDSTRILAVRHLWRSVRTCDGSITPRYGIDRLSLIAPDGERTLFDVPLHASMPGLTTSPAEPVSAESLSGIAAVIWSPDNVHAAAWLSYRSGDAVSPTRLFVIDVVGGAIHDLDSGFAPTWNTSGSRLTWLRADTSGSTHTLTLIDATPDNRDRHTRSLPVDLAPLAGSITPIWNNDGTRLISCVRPANDPNDPNRHDLACQSVAIVDLGSLHVLSPQIVPNNSAAVRWIMADRALLWLPDSTSDHPLRIVIQPSADSTNAGVSQPSQLFDLPDSVAGDRLIDAAGFPDGQHVLIVVRSTDSGLHYWVFDSTAGTFRRVKFTA